MQILVLSAKSQTVGINVSRLSNEIKFNKKKTFQSLDKYRRNDRGKFARTTSIDNFKNRALFLASIHSYPQKKRFSSADPDEYRSNGNQCRRFLRLEFRVKRFKVFSLNSLPILIELNSARQSKLTIEQVIQTDIEKERE